MSNPTDNHPIAWGIFSLSNESIYKNFSNPGFLIGMSGLYNYRYEHFSVNLEVEEDIFSISRDRKVFHSGIGKFFLLITVFWYYFYRKVFYIMGIRLASKILQMFPL